MSIQFGLKGKCINVVTACALRYSLHRGGVPQPSSSGMRILWWQAARSPPSRPSGWRFYGSDCPFESTARTRCGLPFRLTKSETALSWERVPVWWFWRNWSTRGTRRERSMAELCGYGATSDAYHITSPAEDGGGAARAMRTGRGGGRYHPGQV